MNIELTIHASFVKELFYFAIQQGAPVEKLSAMTELQADHFDDLDARIPIRQIVSLWHAAIELTGNSALALQLGANSQPNDSGITSLVCMSSPTLGEMLSRISRYMRLNSESDRFDIIEKDEYIALIYEIETPEFFTTYAVERSFSMALNWINEFIGTPINPLELHFSYRAPEYINEYTKVFSSPLLFEQTNNAIILSKENLALPAKSYNAYLDDLVVQQAKQLLAQLGSDNNLRKMTQQLIIRQLPTGNLNVDFISEKMNMSRRTLARKLKEENTSFQDLLEKTRKELATDYLKQKTLSINDIAFMLGFSESSAFSRAFKRWFGNHPQEHRASLAKN